MMRIDLIGAAVAAGVLVLAVSADAQAASGAALSGVSQDAADAPGQAAETAPDAPDEAAATLPSACADWRYRVFDFWVGDWDVFDHQGNYAGRNLVISEENGCLIVEHWMSVNGGTGRSFNYYDPGRDAWQQVWVSQSVTIELEGGYAEDGGIALDGRIAYRDGASFPFRGRWTPNRNGTVTQLFEQFDPEADAWTPWFIGIYRRVEDNPEAAPAEDGTEAGGEGDGQ